MPKTTFNIKVELEDGRYCEGCPCLEGTGMYGNRFPYCHKYKIRLHDSIIDDKEVIIRLSECIEEHGGGK